MSFVPPMVIKIVPEPDLHITQAELDYLKPEWEIAQCFTLRPLPFEDWLRLRLLRERTIYCPSEEGPSAPPRHIP